MNGLIVFLGGGLGAFVRYIMFLIMPKYTYLPVSTLVSNFFGCFIATIVFMFFVTKTEINSEYKMFLITGFCGGLSTLSALSLELLEYIQAGEYVRVFLYSISTFIICSAAVILGVVCVKQ